MKLLQLIAMKKSNCLTALAIMHSCRCLGEASGRWERVSQACQGLTVVTQPRTTLKLRKRKVEKTNFNINLLPLPLIPPQHNLLPSHLLTQMPAAGFAAPGLPVAPRPGVAAV